MTRAVSEACGALGAVPTGIRYQNSRNVVRVLWALEVAYRAGLGSIRATDIRKIVRWNLNEDVALAGIASFLRMQKQSGDLSHLWKEGPEGFYRISNAGRDVLTKLLKLTD